MTDNGDSAADGMAATESTADENVWGAGCHTFLIQSLGVI